MDHRHHVLSFALLAIGTVSHATHITGGELRYEHIEAFTYRILGITYTDPIQADSPELTIDSVVVPRTEFIDIPGSSMCGSMRVNTYETIRTFPGPGVYTIRMWDVDRTA